MLISSNVVNKAIGRELRSEVNSVMLVGAKVKQYYQCIDPAGMTPFWGYDAEGNLLEAEQEMEVDEDTGQVIVDDNGDPVPKENGWKVKLDFRTINITLNTPVPENFDWVGENELRAAAGNFESFKYSIQNGDNKESILFKYFGEDHLGLELYLEEVNRAGADAAMDGHIGVAADDPTGKPSSNSLRDAKALHHWLNSYASEVYGKQFLAYFTLGKVVCMSIDSETGQVIYSDEVSGDGGWASEGLLFEDAEKILELPNPSIETDRFKDESGKVQPMIQFDTGGKKVNTKGLNNENFVVKDNKIWIKGSVSDKWVHGTPLDPEHLNKFNIPEEERDIIRSALVTLSNSLVDQDSTEDSIPSSRPLKTFTATGPLELDIVVKADVDRRGKIVDGQSQISNAVGDSYMLSPIGMGIPVKSNTTSYGPWKRAGANPGSTYVEIDEGTGTVGIWRLWSNGFSWCS